MIRHLKPHAEKNAISRVVASIHLSNEFVKPKDILEKLTTEGQYKRYPKKGILKQARIELGESIKASQETDIGFIFEEFDEIGLTKSVFRVENVNNSRARVSLESTQYNRWADYRNQIEQDLISFGTNEMLYYDAIGLKYQDSFTWEDDSPINIKVIFDNTSELLNKKFLEAENSTLIFFSQSSKENHEFEERTEISFNNSIKRISIVHDYAIKLPEPELIDKQVQKEIILKNFDIAHEENKEMLKAVLTKECQDLIGLK